MTFQPPKIEEDKRPSLPSVVKGEIYENVGKYARGAVMYAFNELGGPQALAKWGEDNKDDFYTKLFPKIIAKESEVHVTRTLDQLSELLDSDIDLDAIEDAEIVEEQPVLRETASETPVFERTDFGAQDYDPLDLVEVSYD